LSIFCELSDGFRLAEEDLKLRGPGEFVGEAQHGLPFFRVGDLLKDELLIAQARDTAKDLVEGRVSLTMKEYTELNRTLQNRFGHKIQLTRVG
jgi:ATP-dependent DNA helicase RecG